MKNNKIKDKKSKIDKFDKLFMIFYFIDIFLFLYLIMCIPIGRFNLTTIFIYLLVGGITYYLLKKHEKKSTKEIKTESALYIIKILVVFFPVGVYLMWKNGKNKKLNAVFSVLLAIPIIFGLAVDPLPDQSGEEEIPAIAYKKTIEPETTELHETSATTTEKITTTSKATQTTKKTTTTKTTTSTTATESAELDFTQLYIDFFEPYEKSFNKLTLEEFQQLSSEKFADYDVQTTEGNENDLWSFTISDSNSDSVYIAFYPDNATSENPVEDWVWTLTTLSYSSNGNEISISDRFHINSKPTYTIYNKNAETPSKEVNSLDELKKFMFSVDKKSTTDETTTTETTTTTTTTTAPPETEPPTEAPVTEAPPPPPEPVQPVIAESNYVLNTSTMKAHYPSCRDVGKIAPENRSDYYGTAEELQSMGYTSCGHCDVW